MGRIRRSIRSDKSLPTRVLINLLLSHSEDWPELDVETWIGHRNDNIEYIEKNLEFTMQIREFCRNGHRATTSLETGEAKKSAGSGGRSPSNIEKKIRKAISNLDPQERKKKNYPASVRIRLSTTAS
jgi:hypothetical protein